LIEGKYKIIGIKMAEYIIQLVMSQLIRYRLHDILTKSRLFLFKICICLL